MDKLTDRELLTRAADGDVEAFGPVFERHARSVYNFCFRRTADWALAKDLMSVVFLEAWRHREAELKHETALPWLLGIATNVLRNHSRALRRHRAALERIPKPTAEPDFADDLSERIDDERWMRRVLAAVELLPLEDREVLALCVWSELSYEETAAALGVPVGTVRSRLSRARRRLRDMATPNGGAGRGHASATAALQPSTEEER